MLVLGFRFEDLVLELVEVFLGPVAEHVCLLCDVEVGLPEGRIAFAHLVQQEEDYHKMSRGIAFIESFRVQVNKMSNLGIFSELILVDEQFGGHVEVGLGVPNISFRCHADEMPSFSKCDRVSYRWMNTSIVVEPLVEVDILFFLCKPASHLPIDLVECFRFDSLLEFLFQKVRHLF